MPHSCFVHAFVAVLASFIALRFWIAFFPHYSVVPAVGKHFLNPARKARRALL